MYLPSTMTSSLYLHWAYGWRIFTWFDDLDDYDAQYVFMVILWWLWWLYDDDDDLFHLNGGWSVVFCCDGGEHGCIHGTIGAVIRLHMVVVSRRRRRSRCRSRRLCPPMSDFCSFWGEILNHSPAQTFLGCQVSLLESLLGQEHIHLIKHETQYSPDQTQFSSFGKNCLLNISSPKKWNKSKQIHRNKNIKCSPIPLKV